MPGNHEALVSDAPSRQNVVDIFAGEWSSILPGLASGGHADLFADARITLLEQHLGPVRGARVLELGPLEGGHSYMLAQLGAESVTAVEANPRAFLRLLCVKELYGLTSVTPLLGDFMPHLRSVQPAAYDIALASGVLYHMTEPLVLLDLLADCADRLCLWTHVYDPELVGLRADSDLFDPPGPVTLGDFSCQGAIRRYPGDALAWRGFSGGAEPYATWLTREGILGFLALRGYTDVQVELDHRNHPNGPALAIYARRPTQDKP